MSEFLDKKDIRILTDCGRKADQIAILRQQGIQFYINKSGWPVVPKSAINGMITEEKQSEWKPDAINQ